MRNITLSQHMTHARLLAFGSTTCPALTIGQTSVLSQLLSDIADVRNSRFGVLNANEVDAIHAAITAGLSR